MKINTLTSLKKIYSGKVRDLYDIDNKSMLMVATDRLSTFDIILNQTIPNKGIFLTQISLFWFNQLKNLVNNHLTYQPIDSLLSGAELDYAANRSVIVKKLQPLPVEVIIRGYLAGTGYKDYVQSGEICGIKLPKGLKLAQQLPQPIFTPSTKAINGQHDENITLSQCKNIIGLELTQKVQTIAVKIYQTASQLASNCGIIIADTKLEFGLDENGNLLLMDEVLTPDSSRFWDKSSYTPGTNPANFDKQFVRDYLEITLAWDKKPPIPDLPDHIIKQTAAKYFEITKRLNIAI